MKRGAPSVLVGKASLAQRARAVKRLMAPGVQLPVYALVFVTNRCDAKCKHCFYWQELNQNPRAELSIDEYDALARSMGPMLQVTLTGGSPELRRDLPEITRRFVEHCRPANITFCMNGYHTRRIVEHAEEVLRTCPDQHLTIGLSLDGIGDAHDEVRGMPGLFDRVVETFRALRELRAIHGPRFRLAAAIVVSGVNHAEAKETAAWARAHLPIDVLKPILVRGDVVRNPTPDARALEIECGQTYLDIVDGDDVPLRSGPGAKATAMAFAVSVKEMVQRGLISEIQESGVASFVCSGARETVVIHPDGRVAGCEMRPEILGRLRDVEMDLSRIWKGDLAREFRSRRDPDRCPGCTHHCFISPPIFRSPTLWPRVARAAWNIGRGRGTSRRVSRS
ncbi:MAG: radical SAM protein [Planctomycetes bacterium]|nr:radical SAM protein [Planctomycetota bacterium]